MNFYFEDLMFGFFGQVNEDIYEKLTLLEYHMYFCKPMHREPVSKVFFSISDGSPSENNKKFFYFAELCYWIM